MTNHVRRFGDDSVMRLLEAGVPLSLLLDLASPVGPDSERIATVERPEPGRATRQPV